MLAAAARDQPGVGRDVHRYVVPPATYSAHAPVPYMLGYRMREELLIVFGLAQQSLWSHLFVQ